MTQRIFPICLFFWVFFSSEVISQTNPTKSDGFINKIFGGEQIDISETPYQVSLKINGQHICGGIIISNTWILTAAHCLTHQVLVPNNNNTFVHVGINDRLNYDAGQMVHVNQFILHPDFNSTTFENDIALLHLSSPLVFNELVMPIEYANQCNTSEADFYEGRNIIISGWGNSNSSQNTASQFLNAVTIPIIDRADAMTLNLSSTSTNCPSNISLNMLAFFAQGIAAGKADSGGPAVMSNNGHSINIGVTSWGCQPATQMPSIYVNVRNYASWIEQETGFSMSKPGVDLYTRDRPWDLGAEPSNVDFCWVSDDIWIRNQNDGATNETHQNPIYNNANPNYINVRIRNRGCLPSSGNDVVKLYWAKASTALAWPNHWNGSLQVNNQSLGDYIGEITIPVIEPGGSVVVAVPWFPPNPLNYTGLSSHPLIWNEEPHHFCILSRIVSSSDPFSVTETNNLADNIQKNNNISLKNVSVMNFYPLPDKEPAFSSIIFVGNHETQTKNFRFDFKGSYHFERYKLDSIAEFVVTLDSLMWKRWVEGGKQASANVRIVNERKHELRIYSNSSIGNIAINPGEQWPLKISVHFVLRNETENVHGKMNVVQVDEVNNAIVGGEQFEINRMIRSPFSADAGGDKTVSFLDSVLLVAMDIFENAKFNWYDSDGELVHTGREFRLLPNESKTFRLEVVSLEDGSKDYDSIQIVVQPASIESIIPNPASDVAHFTLNLPSVGLFYLIFTNVQTGSSTTIPIDDNSLLAHVVNLNGFASGYYAVSLASGNTIFDSKFMYIQNP
jgi:secreted trypsin-like serine protease